MSAQERENIRTRTKKGKRNRGQHECALVPAFMIARPWCIQQQIRPSDRLAPACIAMIPVPTLLPRTGVLYCTAQTQRIPVTIPALYAETQNTETEARTADPKVPG